MLIILMVVLTQFTILTSETKLTCDALPDLVPLVQFKKHEKQPWRSVTFSKVTLLYDSFSRFLKSYKRYQIAQRITYITSEQFCDILCINLLPSSYNELILRLTPGFNEVKLYKDLIRRFLQLFFEVRSKIEQEMRLKITVVDNNHQFDSLRN